MFLSHQLSTVNPSATLRITQKVRAMRAQGIEVIGLGMGEPDFDTPEHIKQAAVEAIACNKTKYTNVDGIPELKSAICDKFSRDNQLHYNSDQINVSPGGKAVIYNALLASLNPGDEVIIPTPCWVSYPDMVRLAGGTPVFAKTSLTDGFKLKPETLDAVITSKTKWLLLNSPSNPTGVAYTAEGLQAIADVIRCHSRIWVLTDDIYEHLVYDGFDFATFAQVAPDLHERTLTMNGVSKAYAMTGWRIGYAGGPETLIRAMAKVMGQTTSNPSSISQWAAVAALNGPQDFIGVRNKAYKTRRDMVVEGLNAVTNLDCPIPDGAFYVFPDCSHFIGMATSEGKRIESDLDFVDALLEKTRVAVVPGTAFHASPNFRMSYCVAADELREACERIANFCAELE